MTTYTFGIRFRFDSAEYYQTYFDLALSDEEITFVMTYLKVNGDMHSGLSSSRMRHCSTG